MGALAEGMLRRPGATVGAAVVLLALFAALAAAAGDRLPVLGSLDRDGPGSREPARAELVVVTRGTDPVSAPVYDAALGVIVSGLNTDSAVRSARRGAVGRDRRTTALFVSLADESPRAREQGATRVYGEIDPGPLELRSGGAAAIAEDSPGAVADDVIELELLALPMAIVALVLGLGWRSAVGAALCAALGALGGTALLILIGEVLSLSAAGLPAAAAAGLVVALDAAGRRRAAPDDAGLGEGERERAKSSMARRRRLSAGAAGALAALALLCVGVPAARSIAVGAALGALMAAAAAALVLPSVLLLLDGAARRFRDRLPTLAGRFGAGRSRPAAAERRTRRRLPRLPRRRAAPGAGRARRLPQLPQRLRRARRPRPLERLRLARPRLRRPRLPARLSGLAAIVRRWGPLALAGLAMLALAALAIPIADASPRALAAAALPAETNSARVLALADRQFDAGSPVVEAFEPPGPGDIVDELGLAALVAALMTVVACYLVSRSALVALPLGVAAVLPATASLGLVELGFGEGHLESLLDYESQGAIHASAALASAGALVAIAAARSVGAAGGLRDASKRSLATSTVIGALAFGVLAGSDLVAVEEFGLALAVGLLLDLVVVRLMLVPALAAARAPTA